MVHSIRRLFHSFMLMIESYYVYILSLIWIGMRHQHWDLVLKEGNMRHNSYMVVSQLVHTKIFLEGCMFWVKLSFYMIGSCIDNSRWFALVSTRFISYSGQIQQTVPVCDMDELWIKLYQYELYDEFKPDILPRVGILSIIGIESGLTSFGYVFGEFGFTTAWRMP